jgi:uncharacterized protein YkwD
MFSDRPHVLPRWTIFGLLLFITYLSSLLEFGLTGQPYLDKAHPLQDSGAVQGSASTSGQLQTRSQVNVIGVGENAVVPQGSIQKKSSEGEWGVAKQVDEHTWTMQVADDARMATSQEIFVALNSYRQKQGKGTLIWDNGLASYAKQRSDYFVSIKKLDGHAGFSDFVDNQDGFKKLGFGGLGENSSYGYKLEGVHLIEWVYAGDKPHNDNQLNSAWTHVGIGVSGTATNLIFGGDKF